LYEGEPDLWDSSSENYKNKHSREAALERIVSAMELEGFSTKTVTQHSGGRWSPQAQKILVYDAGTIPRANNTAVSTSKFNSPEDGSV
jgi:hypothetical protein